MCWRCNEDGMIVICMDDICRGLDHCIHGSGGMAICPECGGEDYQDDDYFCDEED